MSSHWHDFVHFWLHEVGWLGRLGFALIVMCFALSFVRKAVDVAYAGIAFGATAFGLDLLSQRLDATHVIGAVLMLLYALVIILVSAYAVRRAEQ